jgi:hypothetical protein
VLKRLKGALAALAGCAALDPLCARRSDAITTNGRMRRATVRRGFGVLDAVASAIPTPDLTRLAACIAVFTAVSLPTPSERRDSKAPPLGPSEQTATYRGCHWPQGLLHTAGFCRRGHAA